MRPPRPAVHRTIMVVDVERFADRRRTNPHQVIVRDALYEAVRRALKKAGISWTACRHEDRGDGMLVLAPAQIPKAGFVDIVPAVLAAALHQHNQGHPVEQQIRLRMALNAGEVQLDRHGVTSTAVNHTFRLLDARPVKTALADSPGVLALITSGWFFEEVVRHSRTVDPATFRAVRVSEKETSTVAWIALPDHPYPTDPTALTVPPLQPTASPVPHHVPAAMFSMRRLAVPDLEYHRPDAPGQPVRLAPRPGVLAGREELLVELQARLADGPAPRTAALCGLGGVGKTSVAVEYAHRHLGEALVCWQFPAEEPMLLEAEFAALAAQLGVRHLADIRDPIASVHAILARQEAGWLLIFDNVTEPASVQRFLPPAGPGRILITTQSQHWPPDQALAVPVLGTDVAASFLASRTGSTDQAAAVNLADELGGLPLALAQAAAYMRAAGMSMKAYLELFRARQADLLGRGEAAGHPAHVAATLGLALSEMGKRAPAALALMRLLAFLAPEPVPLGLLLGDASAVASLRAEHMPEEIAPLLGDPVASGDAIAALRRYSLITLSGDGVVLVHRLVKAVTRAALTVEDASRWGQAAATLVDAAIPAEAKTPAEWPACALLLPHTYAVLDLASGGMRRIADYLEASGRHRAARDLFQEITDALAGSESYGPEHPSALSARQKLAYLTGDAGDPASARDQLAALLPVRERVLGPEHPDTLATRHGLAWWTGWSGDFAGARDQLAALLPVRERVLGPEHPDTLATRHRLAHWTGWSGDFAGARDQMAALLPVLQSVIGPEHPDIFTARQKLAYFTGEAGDPAAARDQMAALLPVHKRVMGPEHPHVFFTRRNLARATGHAGDPAAARDQFAGLLRDRERVLGPEHPHTLTTRWELARWTGIAGDPAAARDQMAALLPVHERVIGPEHPDTLSTRSSLAHWAGEAGTR